MELSSLWDETGGAPIAAPGLEGDVTADVAIIGGGYTGCSAALHLAEAGASVRLLEANRIGHGGSGRNAGLVNAGLWMEPDKVEAALGKEAGIKLNEALGNGPSLVFSLIEKHGIACEAVHNGTLHCAHSPAGLVELEGRARQFTARGAKVELLDREQAIQRIGSDVFFGALLDRRAGTIQPLAYCRGLAVAAIKAGAKVHEGTTVAAFAREGGGWRLDMARGRVLADKLLIATDGYHEGAPGRGTPSIVPMHYFQLATKPLGHNVAKSILPGRQGAWDTAPIMSHFRLDAAGRLLIGAMGMLSGPGATIHRDWARRRLRRLFPQAGDVAFEYAWYGRIAMTSDHLPRVLRLGNGAYSIYGYNGRGISPGTTFGRAMAQCLLRDDESLLPLAPIEQHQELFRLARQAFLEAGVTAAHLVLQRI